MSILSIQSSVVHGHVGNSAAIFPLQRLGFEAWAVPTVLLSNHPGHGGWRGQALDESLIGELIEGLAERGVLGRCRAVLSGYLGQPGTAAVVAQAVGLVKAARPDALYLCDPVMGDDRADGAGAGGFYVDAAIPSLFRDLLLPVADIATPNRFELEFLANRPVTTLAEAMAACEALRLLGPREVVATSLRLDPDEERVAVLAVAESGAWLVETPLLPLACSGAGDLLAAVYLAWRLRNEPIGPALSRAVSSVFAIIAATEALGGGELRLIAAQTELPNPSRLFPARRLR